MPEKATDSPPFVGLRVGEGVGSVEIHDPGKVCAVLSRRPIDVSYSGRVPARKTRTLRTATDSRLPVATILRSEIPQLAVGSAVSAISATGNIAILLAGRNYALTGQSPAFGKSRIA